MAVYKPVSPKSRAGVAFNFHGDFRPGICLLAFEDPPKFYPLHRMSAKRSRRLRRDRLQRAAHGRDPVIDRADPIQRARLPERQLAYLAHA